MPHSFTNLLQQEESVRIGAAQRPQKRRPVRGGATKAAQRRRAVAAASRGCAAPQATVKIKAAAASTVSTRTSRASKACDSNQVCAKGSE